MPQIPRTPADMGRKGGRRRAQKLTAARRREIARLGGLASKGKPRKRRKKKAKKKRPNKTSFA